MLMQNSKPIIALALILSLAGPIPISSIHAAQPVRVNPPAQIVPETYFGMHMHGIIVPRPYTKRVTPWPDIPFGAWRLMDAYVKWYELEPRKNEFHFERLDEYVAIAQEKHVKVLLPLVGTPSWASARPTEAKSGNPPGTAAEPADMDDWRNFVRTVATRYKGKIEAYEIWNEPNEDNFWTGKVEQLVDMTREAFQIIKSVDPNALVVSPSCTVESGPQYLDGFLNKGGGKFVDGIGYHFYVRSKPPEAIVDIATRLKEILLANHVDKPIWNTESGWADPKPFPSDELGAAYVARALTLAWAAGVSRFYWYAWDNHSFVTLQMVDMDDMTKKPASKAYTAIHQWLAGAVVHSCESNSTNNWTCELEREGKRQWMVWNTNGPAEFSVPADWHASFETPLLGSKEKLKDEKIQIGLAPILLEGSPSDRKKSDRDKAN
jgi:GH35 family endo-1,4-beta-xylanase